MKDSPGFPGGSLVSGMNAMVGSSWYTVDFKALGRLREMKTKLWVLEPDVQMGTHLVTTPYISYQGHPPLFIVDG